MNSAYHNRSDGTDVGIVKFSNATNRLKLNILTMSVIHKRYTGNLVLNIFNAYFKHVLDYLITAVS
jgi:hypothetical protein